MIAHKPFAQPEIISFIGLIDLLIKSGKSSISYWFVSLGLLVCINILQVNNLKILSSYLKKLIFLHNKNFRIRKIRR
jgi:hypothetical protein